MTLPRILYDDAGTQVELFTLPLSAAPDVDSVLMFSLPKAGSVLLDSIGRAMCAHAGLTYVSIFEELFNAGLVETKTPTSTSDIFLPRGYCYGGFRYYPYQFEIPIADSARSILLIRDPRDMLVSLYFSARKSHPDRGARLKSATKANPAKDAAASMDIDCFALRMVKMYKTRMAAYVDYLAANPGAKVYRYEDVIYEKARWIADMAGHFGWEISGTACAKISADNDIIPPAEQEDKHIRQVHPGNYKSKLRCETIQAIDEALGEQMQYFSYAPSRRFFPSLSGISKS